LLVVVSTHWLPQLVVPEGQPQAPELQIAPPPQVEPQAPQFLESLLRSTQAPEQFVSPVEQFAAQRPAPHS
jgi:hypothetical protein